MLFKILNKKLNLLNGKYTQSMESEPKDVHGFF